jgi:hypothetical protein
MSKDQEPVPLRRSSRLHLHIPVTVSGIFPDGRPFTEETYLTNVGKYGASLKTQLPLQRGMEIRVRPKNRRDVGLFRVVWLGEEGSTRADEVGIEYVEVSNFLGISFPD